MNHSTPHSQSRRTSSGPMTSDDRRTNLPLKVVLFSGGRGSRVLSKQLISNRRISLTIAINGYDDGASTGEVRRFLGDSLGPSDFRKNASRLARELQSCSPGVVELLDLRFPLGYRLDSALTSLEIIRGQRDFVTCEFESKLKVLLADIDDTSIELFSAKLFHFINELTRTKFPFSFSDCSIGNLVFAGCFLEQGRNFNAAIANYCALLKLPTGLIENVTDGRDAHLIALDRHNRLLGREAEIVDASRRNHVSDIFLIDRALTDTERRRLTSARTEEVIRFIKERSTLVAPNRCLLERIGDADFIIYSPGTQHSSLFPSYLTPGLGKAVAENLKAVKLLITNIQEDAEIPDISAVDIIEKAVYYLKEKNTRPIPTPCLITHYLINDPSRVDHDAPYVPLGRLETLEDPRLVRIGNYEEGVTGYHNAAKLLTPFIGSFLKRRDRFKIAVLLLAADSLNKISQTILEMLRGGIQELPVSVTLFHDSRDSFDSDFINSLPFKVFNISRPDRSKKTTYAEIPNSQSYDYVILFESSGMYKGEDIVNLASLLNNGRLDAVWGSRRLSIRDIRESYKLRYRHNFALGAISYVGSHILSFAYLLLYGRYISDTLSSVRAIRTSYMRAKGLDFKHKCVNHHILSLLLRDSAEIFETPVQFFPISPKKVRRTTVLEGLQSLGIILWWRFKSLTSIYQDPVGTESTPTLVASGLGAKTDIVR